MLRVEVATKDAGSVSSSALRWGPRVVGVEEAPKDTRDVAEPGGADACGRVAFAREAELHDHAPYGGA
jgi:hypothetical protein